MDIVLRNILPFLAMLVVLIVVHELGHFVTAKLAGVKVLEFGLGYPPKLWGVKRGETEYTINALPLGGFVRLLGEEDPGDPRSLAVMIPRDVDVSRARVSDVVPDSPAAEAGLKPGDVIFAVNGRNVQSVSELGYQIRLHLGQTVDMTVRRVGGAAGAGAEFVEVPVYARWSANAYAYTSAIGQGRAIAPDDIPPIELPVTSTKGFDEGGVLAINPGAPTEERFEYCMKSPSTLTLTERAVGGTLPAAHGAGSTIEHRVAQGPTGIRISSAYSATRPLTEGERAKIAGNISPCDELPTTVAVPFSETQWDPPWQAVPEGARRSFESLILARNEIISRIKGGVGGSGGFQVTGPVGIAQLTGEVVKEAGWKSLMDFAALISMNLAVLNILPLPMLDGGRVVFVLLEYARGGRRVSPQKEAMVHFIGLVAMLTLAVVITYFDIARIFAGDGILR